MRHKFEFGIFSLLVSFLFLAVSFKPTLSGGAIGINPDISFTFIISLVFFLLAIVIFAARQTLDAILIPTGDLSPDLKRTEKAYQRGGKDEVYLISGIFDQPFNRQRENYRVYKKLRDYGVRAGNIRVEAKSGTTLENYIFSLEKLKKMGAHDVGISSYSEHLDRFEIIDKKAKEEGLVGKDFRIHRIPVPETWGEHIYGFVSNLLYRYELRKGLKNPEKPWFHKPIKAVVSFFVEKAKQKKK